MKKKNNYLKNYPKNVDSQTTNKLGGGEGTLPRN